MTLPRVLAGRIQALSISQARRSGYPVVHAAKRCGAVEPRHVDHPNNIPFKGRVALASLYWTFGQE